MNTPAQSPLQREQASLFGRHSLVLGGAMGRCSRPALLVLAIVLAPASVGCSQNTTSGASAPTPAHADAQTPTSPASDAVADNAAEGSATDVVQPGHDAAQSAAANKAHDTARPVDNAKLMAPVQLTLTASDKAGVVEAQLAIEATADLPRAIVHFKLPAGMNLVAGEIDQELGPMTRGERKQVAIQVRVAPRGQHELAAGVDVVIGDGMKLHRSATIALGRPLPSTRDSQESGIKHVDSPDGDRMQIRKLK